MEVIVGKLAGFCGGVINSVKNSYDLLEDGKKTYCLGELVHNKQVVDNLKNKGLVFIESLDEVSKGSRVIVRAHGVSKDVYDLAKSKDIDLIDLTCPNVLAIHEKAKKLVSDGYFIVLIAQKNHPEAIGTISFCGEDSIIIEDYEDIDCAVDMFNSSGKSKMAIISQTTYSISKFEDIVNILQEKVNSNSLLIDNTICTATELRQKETNSLAEKVDAMIIIGGKNSSNTKKLYEIAKSKCMNSFIIETVKDLDSIIKSFYKIGIMAGASTPKESIDDVVNYLENLNN